VSKVRKLNICDWYVHQGHQYEFFKTGHKFHLFSPGGEPARWNRNHRPLNKNIFLQKASSTARKNMDIVMVRSPINKARYSKFTVRGAKGVAVVQTVDPFSIPQWVKHVVWNSYVSMKNNSKRFPGKKHYYIPHGYDSREFFDMGKERNKKILTVANSFKKRRKIMGFDLWSYIEGSFDECDIFGHDNEDIRKGIRRAHSLEELLDIYNTYGIYVNTTIKSAMPRSRVEAAMCGMPIVSTNNYDVNMYFKHKKSAILTNNKSEMVRCIKMLLESKQMREDYGGAAREVAIKNFGIKDYLNRWDKVFRDVIGL